MIKVLLVDDHELVRSGIESLLKKSRDIRVVGVAGTGEQAISFVADLQPDIVLMDLNMPGIGGISASKKIYQDFSGVKIIALSVHNERPFPQQLLRIGVHGFISKSSPATEMIDAIRKVYRGERYLCADVANALTLPAPPPDANSPFEQLSQRELQVVMLTLQGNSIQEIANMLLISPKTVNTYRYRVYEKVAVSNDVELTRLAIRHKIIDEVTV